MLTLVRRRLFDAVLVVWLVGTVAFVLLHLAPGDPIGASLTDARVSPAVRAHWRSVYALDQPLLTQYRLLLASLARGDLGYSFSQHRPVVEALRETLPDSLLLMGLALTASVLFGTTLGVWQAIRAGTMGERVIGALTSGLSAVPDVWLALMMLTIFGAQLALFPLNGRCDPVTCGTLGEWASLRDVLHHVALPAATLTMLFAASFARVQRVALRDVLHDDAMRTARAKGVPAWQRLRHHALRRAARPVLTSIGMALPMLVGGTVFVERVFGWPGMGNLLVDAIGVRDYPLVIAVALIGSLLVTAGALLADLGNALLDPRLRDDVIGVATPSR
jgi:peptide/nickel transport system permease protein